MWCPLPWSHVGVKNNGGLRLCSHSQSAGTGHTLLVSGEKPLNVESLADVDAVMNCSTLKQVRKDMLSGVWPSQCRRCQMDSEAGINSRNQWETKKHISVLSEQEARSQTQEDGSIKQARILSYDLRIGNQCNLRCTMCFPGESIQWFSEYEKLIGDAFFYIDDVKYNLDSTKTKFDWSDDRAIIDSVVGAAKGLQKIKFGGGEPLLIKHHDYLLAKMIEANIAKNVELEYSVNLTVFPKNLLNLWSQFKAIKICASLDAFGAANEAVRYRSKWDNVVSNLKMLDQTGPNVQVFTSTTISLLTLEHFPSLVNWIADQNFLKINKSTEHPGASHLVYNPKWLDIRLLDSNQQNTLFTDLLEASAFDRRLLKRIEGYKEYCKNNLNYSPEEEVIKLRSKFSQIFFRLEANQKQEWGKIFPFASSLAARWNQS